MKWKKLGCIFKPSGEFGWMNSHAQVPTVLELEDRLRVYFSTRPNRQLGLTTFLDLDKEDVHRVIAINEKPILEVGPPGSFDNHGAFPSCVRRIGGRVFLYYLGWYRGSSVAYHNAVGLATSTDDGRTFRKEFPGPILDRSPDEPFSAMSLDIVRKGDQYFMTYTSVYDWIMVGERYEPAYHIRLAVSKDGVRWEKTGHVCIRERYHGECIARPAIIERDGVYHMWMSYRGSKDFRDGTDSYRIGYARSTDLINWVRDDAAAGIEKSATGWDSTMITYPCIATVSGRDLMFYNGNDFGSSGFGCAVAEW